MKEFLPLALASLPIFLAFPILLLAILEKISMRAGAILVVIPLMLIAFLYVTVARQPWYTADVIFVILLIALEYTLFKSRRAVNEMFLPSSQFDLLSTKRKRG